jgi:hypothetical protein
MSASPVVAPSVESAGLTRPGLLEFFEQVADPRARRGIRHRFAVLLAVALSAVLAGPYGPTTITPPATPSITPSIGKIGKSRSTVGIIAMLLVVASLLGSAGTVVARKDLGIVDSALLSRVDPPVLETLARSDPTAPTRRLPPSRPSVDNYPCPMQRLVAL